MVRAFAHGVMVCWIDSSWGGPIEPFLGKLYRVSFCCESVGNSFIDRYGHKYTFMVFLGGFRGVFLISYFLLKIKKSSIK